MTRSRFTAAALGAALLGLTAVLVPTASIAEPVPTTPAASLTVIWADGPDDFEPFELSTENGFRIANTWHWTALTAPGENTLADFADFDDRGLTSTDAAPLAIVHGLPAPVQPADFPALMVGAAANVGADAQIGVMVSGSENGGTGPVAAVGGFNGADTQWSNSEGGSVSTSVFAEQLAENESVVTGYFVMLMGSGTVEDDAPEIPEGPELLADPELQLFAELPADAGQGVALRAAAVPAELGVASIRLGDLTTYFTPQPTATLALARASFTDAQASTTGIPVTATGFAPGETVTVGLSRGFSGDEVPGVTFVADADGNVSGTVVLPAALAAVGDASLVLLGSSSGQFAASGLAITAGTAPVAVPVPGRATYTG